MGAKPSSENTVLEEDTNTKESLIKKIDEIVRKFIIGANFQDLTNLKSKDKCDSLVVLTSKLLSKQLNLQEVTFMAKEKGIKDVGLENEKLVFFTKDELPSLEVSSKDKQRYCMGIAKFYIKIAHIWSAIIMTLNPIFTVLEDGEVKKKKGYDLDLRYFKSATNDFKMKPESVFINLCSRRFKSLAYNLNLNPIEDEPITIHPEICGFNKKYKSLLDEPGIYDLQRLYYDEYDYETGEFNKMSDNMKEVYKADLETFRSLFQGVQSLVATDPKEFKDIKLKQYDSFGCSSENKSVIPPFDRKYIGFNMSDPIFEGYKVIRPLFQ